jgi:hypothetical protein
MCSCQQPVKSMSTFRNRCRVRQLLCTQTQVAETQASPALKPAHATGHNQMILTTTYILLRDRIAPPLWTGLSQTKHDDAILHRLAIVFVLTFRAGPPMASMFSP